MLLRLSFCVLALTCIIPLVLRSGRLAINDRLPEADCGRDNSFSNQWNREARHTLHACKCSSHARAETFRVVASQSPPCKSLSTARDSPGGKPLKPKKYGIRSSLATNRGGAWTCELALAADSPPRVSQPPLTTLVKRAGARP